MKIIKQTFKQIKKKPQYFILPILVDLIAVLAFGWTLADVRIRILETISNFQGLVNQSVNMASQAFNESNIISMFGQQGDVIALQNALIKVVIFLFILLYFIWIISQGFSWKFTTKLAGKKIKHVHFFIRFTGVTLVWLLLLTILTTWVMGSLFLSQITIHSMEHGIPTIISSILTIIILYFMFISYALVHKHKIGKTFRKSFLVGIKNFPKIGLMYVCIIAGFIGIDFLLKLVGKINPFVMFITGIFILLPYITWIKLYLILKIDKLD